MLRTHEYMRLTHRHVLRVNVHHLVVHDRTQRVTQLNLIQVLQIIDRTSLSL